jgi:hypothetical protein
MERDFSEPERRPVRISPPADPSDGESCTEAGVRPIPRPPIAVSGG